jgi:hypothetical protein
VSDTQVVPDFQRGFVAYGPNLLDKNKDAGRRFMVAYLKAVRLFNQGKTAHNIELLAKSTDQDPALLQKNCWPLFRVDGHINAQSIMDFQSWAVQRKLLDNPVTDEQKMWDPEFIDYANKALQGTTP